MFFSILFAISFLVILFSLVVGFVIIYHFKRFGIKGDPKVKKLLSVFKVGGVIIILFNLILLLLVIV